MSTTRNALIMALIASAGGMLNAGQGDCCVTNSAVCNIQDSCCESSCGRFYVGADLLYWKAHISGLELNVGTTSVVQATVGDDTTIMTAEEYDADPYFKWKPGYRIAAGYEFAGAEWEAGVVWTHFQDSGTKTFGLNTTSVDVKINQIDLLLAYNTTLAPCFKARPFIGVRGARITSSVDAFLVTDITILPATLATQTRIFDDSQKYEGWGPLLGLEAEWEIGCGFSLYGSAAAGLLYGDYHVHFVDSDVFTPPFSTSVFSDDTRHVHGFDANIDLAIGIQWQMAFCDSYLVNMRLGFEHHEYFNQSHIGTNRGDLSFDGGIFSLGIAL